MSETCIALYDYKARRPIEISFSKGDVLTIVTRSGAWWVGELNGNKGKFPSNYVKLQETASEPPPQPETQQHNEVEGETPVETTKPTKQQPQQKPLIEPTTPAPLPPVNATKEKNTNTEEQTSIQSSKQQQIIEEPTIPAPVPRQTKQQTTTTTTTPQENTQVAPPPPVARPVKTQKQQSGNETTTVGMQKSIEEPNVPAPIPIQQQQKPTKTEENTQVVPPPPVARPVKSKEQTTIQKPEELIVPPPVPRPAKQQQAAENGEKQPPKEEKPTITTSVPAPAPRPTKQQTKEETKAQEPSAIKQAKPNENEKQRPTPAIPQTNITIATTGTPIQPSDSEKSLEVQPISTAVALYDYRAQREIELSFKKGDIINIISQRGKWWEGEINGVRGRMPSNYVKIQTQTSTPSIPVSKPVEALPTKTKTEEQQQLPKDGEVETTEQTKHKHKHRKNGDKGEKSEKSEKKGHSRHASGGVSSSGNVVIDGTITLGIPPPPPGGLSSSNSLDDPTKVTKRSRSNSTGGTTPPPLAIGNSASTTATTAPSIPTLTIPSMNTTDKFHPPATFGGNRSGKPRDIRYATVRLRGTAALETSTEPSLDVTDDYMSMMKWTAEYVPNLTRSLFQDPTPKAAILPDDYIPPPPIPPPPLDGTPETPRYNIFSEPDTPSNVRINANNGQLIAGTLPKIIARLTDKDVPGKELIQAFLMTYRSFAEPMIVLDLLSTRFDVPETMQDVLQEAIQIRVWFFLKEWVTCLIDDFVESGDLSVKLSNLIERMCGSPRESVAQAAGQLRVLFQQKLAGASTSITAVQPFGAPKPMPPLGPITTILDIPAIEAARQLSIMKFEVFKQIKTRELCNLAWTKKDAVKRAPNIVRLIKDFNKTGQWIAGLLLKEQDLAERIKVLKQILTIADECRNLQNFQSVMEIVAALESAPISRLRKMWSSKLIDRLKGFEKIMSKNFKELREVLAATMPPCVPYIGLYFTDLVFIEEGNPNYLLDAPNMVNWSKALMASGVLLQIQRFQQKGFTLFQCLPVHEWLSGSIQNASLTEQQAYQRSLELEPRDKK